MASVEDTVRDIVSKIEPTVEMEECEACSEGYVGGSEYSGRLSYLEYDEDQGKTVYKHLNVCPDCVMKLTNIKYGRGEE